MKDSPNEYEKINIMDEILIQIKEHHENKN